VSAAILVFAADVVVVGARNREVAASQQVGAPMVATVTGGSVRAVRDLLRSIDPHGRKMTTVVVEHPLSVVDQTNLFVDRASFLRIATFRDAAAARGALGRLEPPAIKPIDVVATSVSVDVATETFYENSHREVDLDLLLLGHDGVPMTVRLGQIGPGTSPNSTRQAEVDCAAGCVLTGWKVETDPGNTGSGRILIGPVRTDGGQVLDLGRRSDWTPNLTEGARIQALDAGPQSLTAFVSNAGSSSLVLAHHWVPAILPTVVSGELPSDSKGPHYEGRGLDGVSRPMTAVTRLPWLPASTRNATLADLGQTLRSGMDLGDQAELQVWFAHDDKNALAAVTKALRAKHMNVSHVARISAARATLDESAATWSMQLGVLVGLACLVVAGIGLAIGGAASWRSRARDLAVLRLNGVPERDARRISLGEQLPMVAVAVVTGAAAGVLAAHYALPTLPLLPAAPPVDLVDLSTAWSTVVLLAAMTALALGAVAAVVADLVFRRATPDRVGGGS
jgi:putative ABC transport system permease protein